MLEFRTCAFNYVEQQSKVSTTKVPLNIDFMQMVTLQDFILRLKYYKHLLHFHMNL